MKTNIALSYIAMLSVVGFFLWVIRNFIRGLRQRDQYLAAMPPVNREENSKQKVDWPVHVYFNKTDDIPIPGKIVAMSAGGAYMESSACLENGQEITVYIDIPEREQLRLTANVVWARQARDGRNAAQLSFPQLTDEKRSILLMS